MAERDRRPKVEAEETRQMEREDGRDVSKRERERDSVREEDTVLQLQSTQRDNV